MLKPTPKFHVKQSIGLMGTSIEGIVVKVTYRKDLKTYQYRVKIISNDNTPVFYNLSESEFYAS